MKWNPARRPANGVLGLLAILALWALYRSLAPVPAGANAASAAPATRSTPHRAHASPSGVERTPSTDDLHTNSWRLLHSAEIGPERDTGLISFLESLAVTEPQRALAFALGESDHPLREQLLQAAMRGWGQSSPEEALAWARTQTLLDQGLACSAVIQGAAKTPGHALELVSRLSLEEPEHAQDYSRYLVAAFSQGGKFQEAAAFASDSATEFRTTLIMDAYSRWTQTDPLAAIASASSLREDDTRKDATSAVLARWAGNDPATAADYALELNSETERKFALAIALPAWAEKDPAAARDWIGRFKPSPVLDSGMAAIATAPSTMEQPDAAMIWAESIVANRLRLRTQASILEQWARHDPAAARRYADTIPDLSLEERAVVYSAFKPFPQADETVQFP